MKKVLAIAVLLLVASTMAMAASDLWVMNLIAGSPNGNNQGTFPVFGVQPDATDGVDEAYELGGQSSFPYPNAAKWAQPALAGDCYATDFLSPAAPSTYPNGEKVWPFMVAAEASAPNAGADAGILLQFGTLGVDILPAPATDTMKYFVRLVDAKNMAVVKPVWAGGGVWGAGELIELAIPTTENTWFGDIILPELKMGAGATSASLFSAGYQFEFVQKEIQTEPVVPEPSSLMVLGTGLAGLVGLVSRRRRV